MGWLKKIGEILAKIVGIAQKAEPTVVGFTEALLPQFAPFISTADTIFQSVIKEIVAAETALGAGTGPQKLSQVVANVGPVLDNWVASNFPGAAKLAEATKAGLVNAVVALLNDIKV